MKIFGGLTWQIEGNPGFFCLITEKVQKEEKTFNENRDYIEISNEIECSNMPDLYKQIKDIKNMQAIYVQADPKYHSFIRDFNRWKRDNHFPIKLRETKTSSFEAGVLKIREYVTDKKIVFKDDSIIKAQLKIFSKNSLKNESDFYAVSALCNVILSLRKQSSFHQEKIPNIKGFY
jgi:hypothetical protein